MWKGRLHPIHPRLKPSRSFQKGSNPRLKVLLGEVSQYWNPCNLSKALPGWICQQKSRLLLAGAMGHSQELVPSKETPRDAFSRGHFISHSLSTKESETKGLHRPACVCVCGPNDLRRPRGFERQRHQRMIRLEFIYLPRVIETRKNSHGAWW